MKLKRIIETIKIYDLKTFDFRLPAYVVALTIIGILAISSASEDESLVTKQIIGCVVGFILMSVFALIRYEFIARYYWLMYFVSIILLLLVLTPLGKSGGGAQRWISLFGIQLQPSELTKILILLFFASFLAMNRQSLDSWKFLLLAAGLIAIPVMLILFEPDLSTSIVILLMFCAIIISSGVPTRFIVKSICVIVPVLAALLVLILVLPADKNIIPKYQYNRIIGFFDADNEDAEDLRYQQENSVVAIASGSLTGKGLNNNSTASVKNANFISEPQTDFIFTIIGEELGFVGSFATVILLALIVFECFLIGIRAREQIGKTIAIGYGSIIAFQSLINLGVVTMLLPNTGLTLPFVSAGLSSLIVLYIGTGIVLNVSVHKNISFQGGI